jgi:hypothetical protein
MTQGIAMPVKKRKPIGEGEIMRRKQWEAEMSRLPGIFIGIHTRTPGNGRRHWTRDRDEAESQRESVGMALAAVRQTLPAFPVRARFTRYGCKADQHNLPGMLKHVIDEVAKFYGVDDGDPRWVFDFAQVVTGRGKFGVRIELTSL